jgi:hypothetical protein
MADADSLIVLIDNDQRFANIRQSVDKMLALKKVRGIYDHEMAVKAFAYLAEEIAKYAEKSSAQYEERAQRPWHLAYPANVRRELQQELAHRFETKWSIPAERKYLEKELPKKYQGGKHRIAQLPEIDLKARRRGAYSAAELEKMKTISEGHMEDLKIQTPHTRLWLSRMTKEDGAPYDNQVTVEARQAPGKSPEWKTIATYKAAGSKTRARSPRPSAQRHEAGHNPRTKKFSSSGMYGTRPASASEMKDRYTPRKVPVDPKLKKRIDVVLGRGRR